MKIIYLEVVEEDTLHVFADGDRVGEVAPSVDGWAAYRVRPNGLITEKRIGTFTTIALAVKALTE